MIALLYSLENNDDVGIIKPDSKIIMDYSTYLFWDLSSIPEEIYKSIGGYRNEINKILAILYNIISDKRNILINNGIIINGISGIGKTFVIKEICKILSIPIIEFNSMMLYQGNINEIIIVYYIYYSIFLYDNVNNKYRRK